MAAKKYYAVKKGKKTGIFGSWEECRASVEGFSGAEYKGFADLGEAQGYLGTLSVLRKGMADSMEAGEETEEISAGDSLKRGRKGGTRSQTVSAEDDSRPQECPEPGTLLVYVDGSYDNSLKKYAFGCVFLLPDGRIFTEYGNGDKEQSLRHRNVTGEMLGAMYAVKTAMLNGYTKVEIRYDYEGIEKWVTGAWRSKTELTGLYASSMREWGKRIMISFTKVAAHSNVYYNELADKMAKTGLREGNGIPKVHMLEEE